MLDFGIPGYSPRWLSAFGDLETAHGTRLRRLGGRRLTRCWVVWDRDDDTWFADCPVLLDFEGEQVEINHNKLDELSITWNSISTATEPRWPCGDFSLTWRDDAIQELTSLDGQTLDMAGLTAEANGSVTVTFAFPSVTLAVHNALDENGLAITDSQLNSTDS
ncbi:hypothetical protein ABZ639_21815 [Saccharomonospora sp. NPDC006951]